MIFVHSKTSDGNMSFSFGSFEEVLENRKRYFQKLGIRLENIAEVKQVHDKKIVFLDKIPDPKTRADGMITDIHNLYLMIKIADCIPVAFFDPRTPAICLIHAGTEGLEKGIITNAVSKMKKHFHINPDGLQVKLGPSIGPCCYKKDILRIAQNQLVENGVLKENIENPRICTYENREYFSHRRSQDTNTPEGRFVTILGL